MYLKNHFTDFFFCDLMLYTIILYSLSPFCLIHVVFCYNAIYKHLVNKFIKTSDNALGILCAVLWSALFLVLFLKDFILFLYIFLLM
jgi:hypothetical protein